MQMKEFKKKQQQKTKKEPTQKNNNKKRDVNLHARIIIFYPGFTRI